MRFKVYRAAVESFAARAWPHPWLEPWVKTVQLRLNNSEYLVLSPVSKSLRPGLWLAQPSSSKATACSTQCAARPLEPGQAVCVEQDTVASYTTLLYVWLRFQWSYELRAITARLHAVTVTPSKAAYPYIFIRSVSQAVILVEAQRTALLDNAVDPFVLGPCFEAALSWPNCHYIGPAFISSDRLRSFQGLSVEFAEVKAWTLMRVSCPVRAATCETWLVSSRSSQIPQLIS